MGKSSNKYVVDEFSFSNRNDYNRAMKEKEAISYLMANTDMTDMKAVLKVYNRAVEKKSFQTVVGLEFVKSIRQKLIASGIVSEDTISIIPVSRIPSGQSSSDVSDKEDAMEEIQKYKLAYENVVAGRTIRNMIIVFLIIIIAAMAVITCNRKYSVFTFFTNYEQEIENELIDKYEGWENEINEREKKLEEREKAFLGENSAED